MHKNGLLAIPVSFLYIMGSPFLVVKGSGVLFHFDW